MSAELTDADLARIRDIAERYPDGDFAKLIDALAACEARAQALREALDDYGRHDEGCLAPVSVRGEVACTCFWTQTRQQFGLAATAPAPADETKGRNS